MPYPNCLKTAACICGETSVPFKPLFCAANDCSNKLAVLILLFVLEPKPKPSALYIALWSTIPAAGDVCKFWFNNDDNVDEFNWDWFNCAAWLNCAAWFSCAAWFNCDWFSWDVKFTALSWFGILCNEFNWEPNNCEFIWELNYFFYFYSIDYLN